jgi:23S rRNA (cytosine1962-C5)-methyltransferase
LWHRTFSLKTKTGRLHLRVKPAAESQVRAGHPWIFDESIREQNRAGECGELAVIFDRKDQFLAVGLYDPDSPMRVRVIHTGKPGNITTDWWRERLRDSVRLRAGLFDQETTGGRWINGESDRFPALVLDRYAKTLVLKVYSAIWFARLDEITSIIREQFSPERLILRLSRNITAAAEKFGLVDGQALIGVGPEGPVQFRETGLIFEADVMRGQKTGFFLDQRENRRLVESLARGRTVLNAFSFSGGFSLYAARGGAKAVTDVDISVHALESVRRNFALNREAFSKCKHEFVQADVFEWLREQRGARYDLVILDPPSLAKRRGDRPAALKAYTSLAEAGFALTRPEGISVCCSCSAHVRAEEFFECVLEAARRTRREFKILRQTQEPIDHHASFPEAHYLKAIYLEFGG